VLSAEANTVVISIRKNMAEIIPTAITQKNMGILAVRKSSLF